MPRRIRIDCEARATIAETWIVEVPDDMEVPDDPLELLDECDGAYADVRVLAASDEILGDEDDRVLTDVTDITNEA